MNSSAVINANIEGLIAIIERLRRKGHEAAALDLSREAFGAAEARRRMYRLDRHDQTRRHTA